MNKKYIIGIVVVVVIVGLVAVFSNQGTPQQAQAPTTATNNPPTAAEQQVAQQAGTGNIDDIMATISSDTSSDNLPIADSDSSTLSENDQALNNFGQSLNTQF